MLASWTLRKAYCKYALLQNTPGLARAGTSPQATAKANSVYAGDLGYNCNEWVRWTNIMSPAHPEPQLVAQAVVAFRHNNLRRELLHQDPLAHTIFPGIIGAVPIMVIPMIGTAPTLFEYTSRLSWRTQFVMAGFTSRLDQATSI